MPEIVGGGGGAGFDWTELQELSAVNLIRNSPGQIITDGVEPEWWNGGANAILRDEDAVGEGIPDKTRRVFRCTTTADDAWCYQALFFANESVLDAGQTVVSMSWWVYCATAGKASFALSGTNLGIFESDQAGANAWELLTVENVTLDAADTFLRIRLIVDTDTAWYTMPMLNLGARALPWRPRGTRFVPRIAVAQVNLGATGDVAWSDTDCTGNTHDLCTAVQGYAFCSEPDGVVGSSMQIGHDDTVPGGDAAIITAQQDVLAMGSYNSGGPICCNSGQQIRYKVEEIDADSDVVAQFWITGYWRWE